MSIQSLRSALLVAVCAGMTACGADDTKVSGSPKASIGSGAFGKSDQGTLPLRETGRFFRAGVQTGTFDGKQFPAYRFAAYEGTKIRARLHSTTGSFDPVLAVDGPVQSSPTVLAVVDDYDETTRDAEVTLALEPGVYRLIVASYASLTGTSNDSGKFELAFECLENCIAPQLSVIDFVDEFGAKEGEQALEDLLAEWLPTLFMDEKLAQGIESQAREQLVSVTRRDDFPTIPLAALAQGQGFLEYSKPSGEPKPQAVTVDLDSLLRADCAGVDRGALVPVAETVPTLTRGWPTDLRFDDCSLSQGEKLADVLNNLALDNGSVLMVGDVEVRTVKQAIEAILASGHRIEARNNRYYADFVGLNYHGVPVAMPLWIDTGFPLENGKTLRMPAPHSHYQFIIDGPVLHTELSFYMGLTGGTAFRAPGGTRAAWEGEFSSVVRDSDNDRDKVVKLFDTAAALRKKWVTQGASLPINGYAQLGVCMDSTAVLEMAVEETVSLYPLVRAKPQGQPTDDIDRWLLALPQDLESIGSPEVLDRLAASQAFAVASGMDLEAMPFPTLLDGLQAAGLLQSQE